MKIPAIRGKIGIWTYYITNLTFKQVNDYVSRVDDELHQSKFLKDLIQRSITDNYKNISSYILNQEEMFFNSLVLAVYDDYPDWQEIEVSFEGQETYKIGLLNFPGNHKIFPVDGQHRVEGIKAALKQDPSKGSNEIAAIFIGHSEEPQLKKRTRRLFTTLNRYAKPVSLRDIIALDEDDISAILTRRLIERFDLFQEDKIVDIKNKAIPNSNKKAFTSIITLYQCNLELCKDLYPSIEGKKPTANNISKFLRFRPSSETIADYYTYILEFWNSFKENLSEISNFQQGIENQLVVRNKDNGGNLLFRPIGILPFVKAVLKIKNESGATFNDIIIKYNRADFQISNKPWLNVVWNSISKKMIMSNSGLTYLLLLFIYNQSILTEKELEKLKNSYASKLGLEDDDEIENVLDDIEKIPNL
ncbi:DGQHR domain-containing protein [Muricauda sp. NFXS6]|uniref:DNA sulfur modification protein DndB n=1 Tax=Allomuricauda sp. NFXS6 TaxID=2819094 RepID=UPI0032E034F3